MRVHDDELPPDALRSIVALGEMLVEARRTEEAAEKALEAAKSRVLTLARVALPEAMREAQIESFRLSDGSEITLRDDFFAAISPPNREAAHAWLQEHGFGGLIKSQVKLVFGRGEIAAAVELARELDQRHPGQVQIDEAVHPQTLTAWVRERAASGALPPEDLFGVRPFTEARVKFKSTKSKE
jgi:hypothetical protein